MVTSISNSKLGGISRAVYIPATNSNATREVRYNAGKAGVPYRFLEYGISHIVSDPSDFNILENFSIEKQLDYFGTTLPDYDDLENFYNTAVPCDLGEESNPQYHNYFGSFVANEKYIYAFLIPEYIKEVRLFSDIDEDQDDRNSDMLIDFTRDGNEDALVCSGMNYLGNRPWVDGNEMLRIGDKVIIRAAELSQSSNTKIKNYGGFVYSVNSDIPFSGDLGSATNPYTISQALAIVKQRGGYSSTLLDCYIVGTVGDNFSEQDGEVSFTLVSEGDELHREEVIEAKVLYISITQVGRQEDPEVQVGYKSWMQLVNPLRNKLKSNLTERDTKIKVSRAEQRGDSWYDAASGTILGTTDISSERARILENKKALHRDSKYSPWKVYRAGEKTIYSDSTRFEITTNLADEILELPEGEVYIYGSCNVDDILISHGAGFSSIWFTGKTSTELPEGTDIYLYSQPTNRESSLVYRAWSRKIGNTEVPTISVNPVELKDTNKNVRCLKFILKTPSIVKILCSLRNGQDKADMVVEYPKVWISLRDNNIGNKPNILSPYWSTEENLTNYYSQITELVCNGGKLLPSGLINVRGDRKKIGAKLELRPGWGFDEQESGIEITQRMDENEHTYFYVSVEKGAYWKRRYDIRVTSAPLDINFQFPIITSNVYTSVTYSDGLNIDQFYRTAGNINNGVEIDVKDKIRLLSLSEYTGTVDISEFLETQDVYIEPEFPGMEISDSGVATIEEVDIYSGTYKFGIKNRVINLLMANSYDFSVSNPYDQVEYGSTIDGISFTSETGKVPGWIWIDKKMDEFGNRILYPLANLVNGVESHMVIDGEGYNFTKMIIIKDGQEYKIKIDYIKGTTKIDIIEA